jgi:hypothetical protein
MSCSGSNTFLVIVIVYLINLFIIIIIIIIIIILYNFTLVKNRLSYLNAQVI